MKTDEPYFSVLIPDGEEHELLVLQVVNCLSLQKDIQIYILSSKRLSYLRFSRCIKKFIYRPRTKTKEWIRHIDEVVDLYDIDVILPVFEIGIKEIIDSKYLLSKKENLCTLPDASNFKKAGDKGLLYNHLRENGIPCPTSTVAKKGEFPNISNLNFPVIAKPVIGFGGGQKVKILSSAKEIESYVIGVDYKCNTIYQNYIRGRDVSCNVLCLEGKLKAYSIQDGTIFKNDGLTPLVGFNFVKKPRLIETVSVLMRSLKWSGVANIDCRFDERDKTYKIIEINPRYWINVDASSLAGVNFPYLHCQASLNKEIVYNEAKDMIYLNLKGLVRRIAKNPSMIFRFKFLWHRTGLGFALKDPIPIIYKFVWRTKNVLVRKLFKS